MSKDFSRWEREFCRELGESMRPKPPTGAAYLEHWFPSGPCVLRSGIHGTPVSGEWANGSLQGLIEAMTSPAQVDVSCFGGGAGHAT